MPRGLVVIETHPVQYHAPVYRLLEQEEGIPVTAIYGSDFSVAGYRDEEFHDRFAWDTDLLTGYTTRFLSRAGDDTAAHPDEISARGLRRALGEANPSAILLVGYGFRFHRLAILASLLAGPPILFRGETTDHATRRTRTQGWARDLALRWLYSRCARLLYVGSRSHAHFERLGVAQDKLVFSPYCVDTTPFLTTAHDRHQLRQVTRERLGIPAENFVLLFAGKLSPRKGVDLLVPALSGMRSTTLLVVGDGERRAPLEAEAARADAEVRFVGFKNQRELSPYYHAADALVLPSITGETWGLVVNEALHHGIPCAVSNAVGCQPDLVIDGATGAVCETGSVQSLAAAISRVRRLAADPDTARRCRERVRGFTVDAAAAGIALAYHEATRESA